jgi:ATP-dependent helicase/nuclease subunit A
LSLRDSLAKARDPRFAEAARRLDGLAANAHSDSPFAFYARLLGPQGGRRRMLARLGAEAADALDEFLNLALDYERRETPSLQGFIAWLRAARAEVKRDMEISRDEVRVMTVHGAKGLEAPIVILADTTTKPSGPRDPRLLSLAADEAAGPLVWATARKNDVAILRAAREQAQRAAQDEYRRLLYVAMTRAADRLVVCGTEGVNKRPEGCWYDLVLDALRPNSVEVAAEDGDGNVWRYRKSEASETKAGGKIGGEAPALTLPAWLERQAPAEPKGAQALTPSAQEEAPAVESGPAPSRALARARGTLTHRLMQSLPDIPRERRADAARQHLARGGGDFSETEREEIKTQVLRLLDDPRCAPLFASGSRAEVPIVGRIARVARPPLVVSGQVDRLAVTKDAVLIADYKTNRPAPRSLDQVPDGYVRQLALYRAVLALIYPDRAIRAALVWTDIPDLMEIPAAALDAVIASLSTGERP